MLLFSVSSPDSANSPRQGCSPPVLALLSRLIEPKPMDLVFMPAEVLAVVLSVWIAEQVTSDSESNWLEEAQLLAVYAIVAMVFFFLQDNPHPVQHR